TADSDVTFDIYPYPTGSSIAVALLPDAVQDGGPGEILGRLEDAGARRAIGEVLDRQDGPRLSGMVFSYLPMAPELEGSTLRDLAVRRGRSTGEVLCELLLEQSLKVGYVGEPPASEAVWRQLGE